MRATAYDHTNIVEMLTAHGTTVDLVDDRRKSAWIMAAEDGHSAVVRCLLALHDSSVSDRSFRWYE